MRTVCMLNSGEVHVWCARPKEVGGEADGRRLLAANELERSARYRFECHKRMAVATRVLLRTVLSRYEAVARPVALRAQAGKARCEGRAAMASGRRASCRSAPMNS